MKQHGGLEEQRCNRTTVVLLDTVPVDHLLRVVDEHHPSLKESACIKAMMLITQRLFIFESARRTSRLTDKTVGIMDRCFPAFRAEMIDIVDRALVYGLAHATVAHAATGLLAVVFRHRFASRYWGPDETAQRVIARVMTQPLADLYAGRDKDVVEARVMDALLAVTPWHLETEWTDFQVERIDPTWVTHDNRIHAGFRWPVGPVAGAGGNGPDESSVT